MDTTPETPEALQMEIERLRLRVATLEREVEARQGTETKLLQSEERFRLLFEASREGLAITDRGLIVHVNPRFAALLGYEPHELVGMSPLVCAAPESRELIKTNIVSGYPLPYEAHALRKDGTTFPVEICGKTLPFEDRTVRATAILDISEHKRAEDALAEALRQKHVIEAQAAALTELSTPLLPILPDVVLLPLIGDIHTERAQQMMDTLMEGLTTHHAAIAILDITGVSDVDTQVADSILGASRAVKLLGAELVLTGIRAEVARTFVHMGIHLEGITTRSTLHGGVAYAMRRRSTGQAVGNPPRVWRP